MNPYWIKAGELRLAILPRPRSDDWLLDDLRAAKRAGVDLIISALTEVESGELGLADQANCCREAGIEFLSFPIEDRGLPVSSEAVNVFLEAPLKMLKETKGVAIHLPCRHWAFVPFVRFAARQKWLVRGRSFRCHPASATLRCARHSRAAKLGNLVRRMACRNVNLLQSSDVLPAASTDAA